MKFSKYFSAQARKPSGLFGRFYMARLFDKGNEQLNSFVCRKMPLTENQCILEVGFGTGALIKKLSPRIGTGSIHGIDFSPTMFSVAKKRNKKDIQLGKTSLCLGDFASQTYPTGIFDIIFCVNTIYFWQNPEIIMSKMHRLLKPGGQVCIGFYDRETIRNQPLDADIFRFYSAQEVKMMLKHDGKMRQVDIISEKRKRHCHLAIATK